MDSYINDKNLEIIIKSSPSKLICSDLPIDVSKSLKHEIESIVSHSESLAEYIKKMRLANYSNIFQI